MARYSSIPEVAQQSWSWKVYALIVALAVAIDVLLVRFPLMPFAVVGILVICLVFWSQSRGLAAVIFSCGLLSYSPFETGALSRLFPGDICIGLFLIMWVVRAAPRSLRGAFQPTLLSRPLFAMAVVTALSIVWSRLYPDPWVTYNFPHSDVSLATTQISQIGLVGAIICTPFAVAATIKNWRDIESVVITVGIVVALGTVLTIAALVFGFGGSYDILGATRAYWNQPWDSSVWALPALVLPFLYSGVLFGRGSLRRYGVICVLFVMCLFGVAVAFSRESWFLAFVELLLISVLWFRGRIIAVLPIVVIALLVVAILIPGVVSSVTSFYNPDQVYGLERIYYYMTGLRLFATHLFLGVGAGNYQFFDRFYEGEEAGGISHNHLITIAAETGVPGLLIFLWLLVSLLKLRRKFNLREGHLNDPHYWLKAAGSVFIFAWILECFFREAFFVSAAAGGGTRAITATIFAWILLGILLAVCNLSGSAVEGCSA